MVISNKMVLQLPFFHVAFFFLSTTQKSSVNFSLHFVIENLDWRRASSLLLSWLQPPGGVWKSHTRNSFSLKRCPTVFYFLAASVDLSSRGCCSSEATGPRWQFGDDLWLAVTKQQEKQLQHRLSFWTFTFNHAATDFKFIFVFSIFFFRFSRLCAFSRYAFSLSVLHIKNIFFPFLHSSSDHQILRTW